MPRYWYGLAVYIVFCQASYAACPIELAVYRDRDRVAGIDFRPTGESAAVTNSFRMNFSGDVVFDGFVMWTDAPARSQGFVTHQCPEGDVTGEEIEACTVWRGALYAVGADGTVSTLPREGEPAPARLLFADLAAGMQASPPYEKTGLAGLPFDAFELSGCQE